MSIWINDTELKTVSKGQISLSTATPTDLTNSGQYYPLSGSFTDGNCKNFTLTAGGVLTFIGHVPKVFLFNGSSDLSSSKVSIVTYALFINGSLATGAETPHSFTTAASVESLSITSMVYAFPGDQFQVYAKSNTASTTIDVNTLKVTLWGEN